MIDVNTGKRRTAVLQDVANAAKLVDSLPDISFSMSAALAGDVNSAISDIYHFFSMIKNSRKPLVFTTWSLDNLKTIVEMAEKFTGEAVKDGPCKGSKVNLVQMLKEYYGLMGWDDRGVPKNEKLKELEL